MQATTMNSIFVTGGTGNVGKNVVRNLEKKYPNMTVLVGSRDLENFNSCQFGKSSKFVKFDYNDKRTWDSSLENVDRVFLIALPLDPNPELTVVPFIERCKAKNVKKIVFLSILNAESTPLIKIEEKIKSIWSSPSSTTGTTQEQQSGMSYVILRSPFFDENLTDGFMKEEINKGCLRVPHVGNHGVSWISAADIGEVASIVLLENTWDNKVVDLTGPKPISFSDLASILTKHLGREIKCEDVSENEYKKWIMERGLTQESAEYLERLYADIRSDKACMVSQGVQDITGHQATPFESFVQEAFKSTSASCKPGV